MTDREFLEKLAAILNRSSLIMADEASIRDMVQRYKNPPLSLRSRAALRLTVNDLNALQKLMPQVNEHLKPESVVTTNDH